jgi:adenosylcobinamide-GDP ribazoletransferase
MATAGARISDLAADLKIGLLFYTRLPLPHPEPVAGPEVARAGWAAPLVGALVGAHGAAAYWLAAAAGLPSLAAAPLALAATLLLTGCLHEDGLADTADGFGGGATRERKLAIMRDGRIGSYGCCAVLLSLLLRAGALAGLASPALAALALIAAHASARATIPLFMRLVPAARADGLSAAAGRPPPLCGVIALLLGALALVLSLGAAKALIAGLLLLLSIVGTAWLCIRQIGGQTGDVIGALEQAGEIVVLLVAAART